MSSGGVLRLSMHTQKTSGQQTAPEAGSVTQEEELRVKGVEALMMEEDGMDDDGGGMLFFYEDPLHPFHESKAVLSRKGWRRSLTQFPRPTVARGCASSAKSGIKHHNVSREVEVGDVRQDIGVARLA
jgi:hypothetical protein